MESRPRGTTPGRGPSMADVARLAGVSSQTVSRVANGHTNVDEGTRDRVLAAMSEIGYQPNRAARALRTGRFRTIGVITFGLSTFGNARTLDAIATAAASADYALTLITLPDPSRGGVSGAYRRLSEQAVDGVVIIFEAHLLDGTDFLLPDTLPVVVVDSNAGSAFAVVDTDQALGARQATEHLLALGHRTVHHLAGPENSFSAQHRAEAWRDTLIAAQRPVPDTLFGDWTAESGYRIGHALAADPEVTAVFAANDQMALGLIRALHEAGRSVPADVSVVGFDDNAESPYFWPPLTTVHQDFAEVGRRSIETLIASIESPGRIPGTRLIPTNLVVRASSAPPPSA